jgi:hypothetical protein
MEDAYEKEWRRTFYRRLKTGMQLQSLFGRTGASEISLAFFRAFPGILKRTIRNTHGKPFGWNE